MDDSVAGAITAVRLRSGTAQQWFELIDTVHSEQVDSGSGDDWDHFQQRFTAAAGGESFDSDDVREFLWYLESNGRMDTVARLCEIRPDLPVRYEQLIARQDDVGPEDDGPDETAYGTTRPREPSSWDMVVERFGPGWASWDGSDEGWIRFRDWTYASANAEDPRLYAAAYTRLDPSTPSAPPNASPD